MDERDVESAYRSYGAAVHARCRRLLKDDQAARDVTQEVFVRCFDKKGDLRVGRELLGWLYRVATNLCLNALRDAKVRRAYEEASAACGEPSADDRPSGRSAASKVVDLLKGLDQRTQAIVVYVYLDGMTQAEAAEVAQVTDRTVRNCLNRFLRRGRQALGIELQEDFG